MAHDQPGEDPRYDNWPIEGRRDRDVEWLGLLGGSEGGEPALYEPRNDRVYRGEVDEANQRIVPVEDSERSAGGRLGDVIEELGDETGWESLSEFAREHLKEDSDHRDVDADRGHE